MRKNSLFCRKRGGVFPTHAMLFGTLLILAFAWLPLHAAQAQTDTADAETYALDLPSNLTPRALTGLYTSVARAGNQMVAVGERGRVIISDDNGISWRQVKTPTSVTLTHIVFATPEDGWAVGGMGVVLHSTDGGLTWVKQFDGVQAATVAMVAAQADIKQFGTNAATTQNLQSAQSMVSAGPTVPFLDVYAMSTSNLMIAGAFGMAFASTDSGARWQSLADFLPNPNGLHIYQILQDGSNFAVAGEQGLLLYGPPGKPLATINLPFQGTLFGEVFAPDHSWIVFGLQGAIMRSTDQGVHWSTVSAGEQVGIDCGITLSNGEVVLGNEAGQILASHDSGQTYSISTVNEPVVGLAQAADGAIIAVGANGPRRISLNMLTPAT